GLVRACHDISEGGLAVAAAEMAFAGDLGAEISLGSMPNIKGLSDAELLFSETNTRFLCEVPAGQEAAFESCLAGIPASCIGIVRDHRRLRIALGFFHPKWLIDVSVSDLKEAWQATLRL